MSITPWSAVIPVAQTSIQEYFSNSVQLTDGTIVVGFMTATSNAGPYTFNIQRYSDTGVALGGPIVTALTVTSLPHLAALTDGGFAVECSVGIQHIVQEYTAAGVAGTSTNLGISNGGDIATMPSGEYVVNASSEFQIVAQNGTPYTPVSFGSTFQNTDVAVSATRIGFIRDNNGTTASIVSYDLNGNNLVFGPSGSSGATSIGYNAIDVLSTGGFVGVFDQESALGGSGVRAIKFMTTKPDGNTLLYGETVISDGLTSIFGLDVKGLSSGGFAITYSASATGLIEQQKTFVKMFDGDGHQVGGEFVLESPSPGLGALNPELTSLSDGRLLVTWMEWDNTQNNAGVKMQILDPRDGYYVGTAGIDKIYGNDGRVDEIHGQAGNDTIYGLAGADILYGESGTDFLYGGRGDDTTRGGADTDYMYGDLGDDEQYGELGNDLLYSGRGADLLHGGGGVDTAYYASEKIGAIINLLNQVENAGSADGDTFVEVERIFGSELANDTISGDNISNTLLGNGGADTLNGNGGVDILRGGTGVDTLNGGADGDFFQYTAINEVGDTIVNFEAIDNFQFTRAAFGNLAGANVAAANFLSVATGHAATSAAQRFIFDQALDQLWYDADGSAAGAAVMVADLTNNFNVTNLDLLLM